MDASWRLQQYLPKLSNSELESLHMFHVELLEANQKLNLISTYTEKNADIIHFFDTVTASLFIKDDSDFENYYDLGSGNGFPGLTFAILNQNTKVHLVEVDERKSDFLKSVIKKLGLNNAFVLNVRAEDLSINKAEGVMCRGFSNLARTLLLSKRVFPKDSVVYSLKTSDWFTELTSLPAQICSTWNTEMAIEYDLPDFLGIRVVLKSLRIS